jgi:methanogenic corrinoid protein MtbC1
MTVAGDGGGPRFAIGVVSRLSGLPTETIRIWERRYRAVTPERSQGQTRRYSAADVRRLTMLREAIGSGHRIGDLAGLSDGDLGDLVRQGSVLQDARAGLGAGSHRLSQICLEYLGAITRFDVRHAYDVLAKAASLLPAEDFVFGVVVPILREIGVRWACDAFSVAHEHLVSGQVRSLLDTLIRGVSRPGGGMKVIAMTPVGQRHEFGILIASLLLASQGLEVIYLGTEVPEPDLLRAVDLSGARLVVASLVWGLAPGQGLDVAPSLTRIAAQVPVWVGHPENVTFPPDIPGIRCFTSLQDFNVAIATL